MIFLMAVLGEFSAIVINYCLYYNRGLKSLRPWCSAHVFCHFWVPSLKSASFSKFSWSSPFPNPIQNWHSEKILGTRVKLCLWGEGRGWACVNCDSDIQKCPKTFLFMIVAFLQTLPPLKKTQIEERVDCFRGGHLYTGYVFTRTQNAPAESNTLYRGALTNWQNWWFLQP